MFVFVVAVVFIVACVLFDLIVVSLVADSNAPKRGWTTTIKQKRRVIECVFVLVVAYVFSCCVFCVFLLVFPWSQIQAPRNVVAQQTIKQKRRVFECVVVFVVAFVFVALHFCLLLLLFPWSQIQTPRNLDAQQQ